MYFIDGNEVNVVVNRILLEISFMDGHNFQVLGIHFGGIPLQVSNKSYCQCIGYLDFGVGDSVSCLRHLSISMLFEFWSH